MNTPSKARQRPLLKFRSLPVQEWPLADQRAWEEACRPGMRLKPGGRASYLAEVSRKDFASRYGAFLDFLQRSEKLKLKAPAAAQVTASSVTAYVAELRARVTSVTTWNCIYKLRRAAELLNPNIDFSWLSEIESELALVMVPRSKFDRLVLIGRIVEAGLTLIAEAESRKVRIRASDGYPKWADNCDFGFMSITPEELRGARNWKYLQRCGWQLVDQFAQQQHQEQEVGRATYSEFSQSRNWIVLEPGASHSDEIVGR